MQCTLPSTLLCIAAGTPAAPALAPLSADTVPITESTGTSEKTATLSSSTIGVSAAAATATTSSAVASSSDSESSEGSGEREEGDEAMEVKEQSDGCEAHSDLRR